MKCKYCDGTGEHINDANRMTTCEFCGGTGEVEVVGDSVTDVCDKCGGTGFFCEMRIGDACTLGSPCPHQEPLTNDEWRRTCSTEEFAEWLESKMMFAAKEQGTFTTKGWEKWLKEIHI